MKARIPKNSNEKNKKSDVTILTVKSSIGNLSELLQAIENDFNTLYEIHGKENLLSISKTLLSSKYLNSLDIPNHSLKHVKTKILSLLENKIAQIATDQYKEKLEKKESLPLNILHSMFQPEYVKPVEDSHFSPEIKEAAKKGVRKAIYAQAEKLGMSQEEFDIFAQNPKEFIKAKKEEAAKKAAESAKNLETQESTEKTFFDRVKGYTNNFQSFLTEPVEDISAKPKEKFENYEQYLKFQTFKEKLQTYSIEHRLSEIQVIDKILSKKSEEFSKIDEDFIKILSERKKVILEQEKDDQEK